jgi:ligand-binding sensor domain-containing protein/serine phosphatase RsbU (regulator of sigma subunit)
MNLIIEFVFKRKLLNSVFLFLVFLPSVLSGQTYRFKNYNVDIGLPNKFVYTVNQDNNGFIWVGTGNGLARFDGFIFYPVQFPDSINTPYPVVTVKDKAGTLWFGFSDGSLFYSVGESLARVEGISAQKINDLFEGTDGYIYIVSENHSLFKVDAMEHEVVKELPVASDLILYSARMISPDIVIIGTQENLLYCKIETDSIVVERAIEGIEFSKVQSIYLPLNGTNCIIATEDNGLFRFAIDETNRAVKRFDNFTVLDNARIQSVSGDQEGNLWISTFGLGVVKLKVSPDQKTIVGYQVFDNQSGLSGSNNVKSVFQDIEGNIWIGLYGDGLSVLTSDAYTYFVPGINPEKNNIIYVNRINDRYFLGTPTGYYIFNLYTYKTEGFTELGNLVGKKEITSYYHDKDNNLWIGTSGGGLFLRSPSGATRQFYRSGNSGEDYINHIDTDADNLWLATLNGVIVLEKSTGIKKKSFTTLDNLPHNSINQLYVTETGRAIVATQSNKLYYIDLNGGVTEGSVVMSGFLKNEVRCFTKDPDGNIWAGTYGNGLFSFAGDTISGTTTSDGLMSNYCYSILADRNKKVWVGHERGFSCYDILTKRAKIISTDFAGGGDCNPEAMYESTDDKVFIGTTQGLIVYDRDKDKQSQIAPFTNITSILINDVEYPYQESITLPFNRSYNIKIGFIGINLSDPGKVYYSTKLDNYDNNWSPNTTLREAGYKLVNSYGSFIFNLISFNEDGLAEEAPLTFVINIRKPFWKTWWFGLSVITLLGGLIAIIINIRERSQKKIQLYLETELEQRTREVINQKEEIELQNLEITDSINYAKRIQSSILPDVNKLKETFKDAFIIFHPRDIVSGDYYWFDKIDDDKFIIVCADSTGHGVPGAFMSMIGSTLLQDIVTRKKITKPSEILSLLDTQIFSTLNQNVDLGVSNDGMDMVICEFSVKTRHLRFASAMRPVIIVMGKEPYYIKGNRSSIGGESVIEKFFDDQEYYLNEGDTVYMFSDGFPDQFGGTDGKKMKIARLKRLVEDINDLSMDEQKEAVTRFFNEWKGSYEQVDDILFMGVRV